MNRILFKFNNSNWPFIDEHLEKELYSEKKITIYVDSIPEKNIIKEKNELWIYLQVESTLISGSCIQHLLNNDSLFDKILTFNKKLLTKKKSIKFLPNNKVYWISPTIDLKINLNLPNNKPINYDIKNKKFQISMLCGSKNWCPGHKLRRKYWEEQERITIPKKFIYSQDYGDLKIFENNKKAMYRKDKTELFTDSMFHIAIENNKDDNYFTEKLIDCFVSKTIPIYYGCPNISDYFNTNGMIIINNINDIEKINFLNKKYYYDRLNFIEENYNKVVTSYSFKEQFLSIIKIF